MDNGEKKRIKEALDLLSSVELKLLELLKEGSQKTFVKETIEVKDNENIVWTVHNGKKFKNCKYKCGNFVSWNNESKRYVHYDPDFKRLKDGDCPKYAEVQE